MGFSLPSWRGIKEFCHDCREWLGRWLLGRGREEEIERQLEKLERELEKERDPGKKAKLAEHVEDLQAAWRGILITKTERLLRKEGYPPYGALVANGKRTLAPAAREELGMLVRAVAELPPPAALPQVRQLVLSAAANYALRRYEEALADWNRALELKPDDPEILNNRGVTYDDLRRYDKALADYNRALEVRPDYAEALNNRGITYDDLGRYDEALADYNRALELKPDYPEALNNRGLTHLRLGRCDEALADLSRALQLKPDDPQSLYNMACLFSLMQRPEDATAYLEKAIALDQKWRGEAATDTDFDNIRDHPRFRRLVGGI